MTTIKLNKKYYDIPQAWDELTSRQLVQVMDAIFLKNYPAAKLVLKLLHILTGCSTYQFFRWKLEEVEEYLYLVAFLLKEDIIFTKNLLSSYKHSHTVFFGPEDELSNLRMKEFVDTEYYYLKWFESEKKDSEALDTLIAILYRPAPAKYNHELNPAGDHREAYNQNISGYYAKTYVADWPTAVKLAIATWYDGCRRQKVLGNPDVFEGGSGDPARYGLVSVMLELAETHVFGDFDKVEEQYIDLVLMQLNSIVDKTKRLEKQSK